MMNTRHVSATKSTAPDRSLARYNSPCATRRPGRAGSSRSTRVVSGLMTSWPRPGTYASAAAGPGLPLPLVYLIVAIRVAPAGVPRLEIVREARRLGTQKLRLRVAHSEKCLRADRKRCARALDPESRAVDEPTFRLHSVPRSSSPPDRVSLARTSPNTLFGRL